MQQRLDAETRGKAPGTFAVIGIGNIGGREMSYADAVELLYVYDTDNAGGGDADDAREFFVRVGCDLTAALRDETSGSLFDRAAVRPQADVWLRAARSRVLVALRRVHRT